MSAARGRPVRLGVDEVHVGRRFTVVARDVAKGRNGSLGVCPDHVVDVALQGMEDGDEDMNVVDTNTHL